MKESRQVIRRGLVKSRFEYFDGKNVPKDILPRSERRKLARARASKDWKDKK